MPESNIIEDPTASLAESLQPNAEIVPADGYEKVIFTAAERPRVVEYLKKVIEKTKIDYIPIWEKRSQNKKAYEGISDKGEAITIPLARAMTNQQHAWLVNTMFSKDPMIKANPLGDSKLDIVITNKDTGIAETKSVTGTDYAQALSALLQYKWTVRLPMKKVIRDWAMEALIDGTVPALIKLVHDDESYTVTQRAAPFMQKDATGQSVTNTKGQKIQIVDSKEFRTIKPGETVQPVNVPGEDFLMPIGETDIQKTPICWMKTEPLTSDLRRKFSSGKYDFAVAEPAEGLTEKVLFGGEDTTDRPEKKSKRANQQIDKRKENDPTKRHVVDEVYWRWPILQDGSDIIEWTELVGEFHEKTGELLCCYKLIPWNGKRPFIDYFMRQRTASYSGTCTVEDVAPFQRYISSLFHLQVQNMVMLNVSVFFVRRGSSAATFLKGKKLRPGMVVEFDEPDDIASKPLGTPIQSMANEIAFLKTGAQEMALVTQYDNASANLSRVTAGAFAQQQELAKMQPELVYETFADAVSRLALFYIQALIQYAPEQYIPNFDEETDAVIDNVLHFPRQMITDEFSFTVQATPSQETKESEFNRDVLLNDKVTAANNQILAIMAEIMKPGVPPPIMKIGLKLIERLEAMLEAMFENTRHDAKQFAIQPEMIEQAVAELYQMAQAVQAAQPQPGGAGDVSDAAGGGNLQAGGGGGQGGQILPPQPGNLGAGAPNQSAPV